MLFFGNKCFSSKGFYFEDATKLIEAIREDIKASDQNYTEAMKFVKAFNNDIFFHGMIPLILFFNIANRWYVLFLSHFIY
jgi:hypothetical protein